MLNSHLQAARKAARFISYVWGNPPACAALVLGCWRMQACARAEFALVRLAQPCVHGGVVVERGTRANRGNEGCSLRPAV
jgi:hypothetical protein